MVATAYGGPEVLQAIDVDPGLPGPGEVLLKVRAAGVNPADWKMYSGAWGTDPHRLPIRLGLEAAGTIIGIGPGVSGIDLGDEVIAQPITGAYAERVVVPVSSLIQKPKALSWEKAACLMVAGATAAHAIAATGVGAGDTVLVHGAGGGVGSMVVQLAHARGARVVGTAGQSNHGYLTDLRATPVSYGPGLVDRVRAITPKVSAAIDTSGTDEALNASVELVEHRSRIATIAGFGRGAQLGVQLLGNGPHADPGTAARLAARQRLVDLWEAGRIDVRIGATYKLLDAARAHVAGIEGRVAGKIVLIP